MTTKQQAVIKDLSENVGKPLGEAMLDAGYSESTSKTPARLTNSKAWKELIAEVLPDELLLKVHREGLEATKIHSSPTEPDKVIPDYLAQHKFLETAYKLKGRFVIPLNVDQSEMSVQWAEDNFPEVIRNKYGISQ